MTTPPPTPPVFPLSAAARAAYEDLDETLEEKIEASSDPLVLGPLNDSQDYVDSILKTDDAWEFQKNTKAFSGLLDQIKASNVDLNTLRASVAKVADRLDDAATLIAAFDKVLTLVPAL